MSDFKMKRRSLLQSLSMIAVGGTALVRTRSVQAAVDEATMSVDNWPAMEYRELGSTGFNGSRLIFGCGAALSNGQANHLLAPALESGINVFDVGYRDYYKDAERHLGPFARQHRDKIFVISKAPAGNFSPTEMINTAQARQAADSWLRYVDQSLQELGMDHVDAYYVMGANNPGVIGSDEILKAFDRVKAAGKATYLGVSTHENAQSVLLAAAETGRYSLAQIAITPDGWYNWITRKSEDSTHDLLSLAPVLEKARAAGIGLIGMKAARSLAGRRFGWGEPDAFDRYYPPKLMQSQMSAFQRSYAYVLANGLDAVNADMQHWQHLRENFVAATTAQQLFV
ncbi:MAG: aldo/keto reductase [Proteobacteria bacterium]|jgi:aryl-alcohol dehydrogenase-like predicted oxidoreductase|nr:aldo/keto reductase [Pseudomonadota bacterium]